MQSLRSSFILAVLSLLAARAGTAQVLYPLDQVKPGLRGTGRTVFHGSQVEPFQFEVLGVLENLTPNQSIILARLSGGPLAETGILQGMSGSPVYVDGKLLGAVALGFPFSKEPIAGIQPIGQMLREMGERLPGSGAGSAHVSGGGDVHLSAPKSGFKVGALSGLQELSTPLNLNGFSERVTETFRDSFRGLGLEPQLGVSGRVESSQGGVGIGATPVASGRVTGTVPVPAIEPGSMISVQLMRGDLNVSADGTVTYVDGKRMLAFGHRFLNGGRTEFPFSRADVVALLPAVNSSFKLSVARQPAGVITADRSTAIEGELGGVAQLLPVSITVSGSTRSSSYHMEVVKDRLLMPLLTQTALFSALDSTERTFGAGTIRIRGSMEFTSGIAPLEFRDIIVSDSSAAPQAAGDAVAEMAFLANDTRPELRISGVHFTLEAMDRKRQLRLGQFWASRPEVQAGETVTLTAVFEGDDGLELTRSGTIRIPPGTLAGALNITASDSLTLNAPDYAGLSPTAVRSPSQLVDLLRRYRDSEAAYIRLWRAEPSFAVAGVARLDLSDPPPSVALILADAFSSASGTITSSLLRGTSIAELKLPVERYAVTGAKTIQIEVKN